MAIKGRKISSGVTVDEAVRRALITPGEPATLGGTRPLAAT